MSVSRIVVSALLGCLGPVCAIAQSNPNNSATNPYYGSVQAVAATPGVKQLSLDDAMRMGIENNLALTEAREKFEGGTQLLALRDARGVELAGPPPVRT